MPIMTNDIALDTSSEPAPLAAEEVEMLLYALDRCRATFAWKVGGLGADALNQPHPPSTMTLGGLIKHLAFVDDWTAVRLAAHAMPAPWRSVDWDADPDFPWHASGDSPQELYQLWRDAAQRCRAAVAEVIADGGLDQRSRFGFEPDEFLPNARRLLVDLHEEYARHVGHADLFREAIDGLVGEDPPQQQ